MTNENIQQILALTINASAAELYAIEMHLMRQRIAMQDIEQKRILELSGK